ncbi:MAG: hypothetical protein JW982_09810 [Spirochaetes bacterium]|nr:hypothetical protein [Spirochaetota bacterium]
MKTDKIPEILLEKYVLDELAPVQLNRINNVIKTDSSIQDRINSIKNSNAEILQKYPPEMFTEIISQRLALKKPAAPKKRSNLFRNLRITVPAMSSLLFFTLFFYFNNFQFIQDNSDNTRIKGKEIKLNIYKKSSGENFMLNSNDSIKNGDLIQLQYFVAEKKYGAIFSIDGNKNITRHFPYTPDSSETLLKPNTNTFLQNSYQLDNAPYFEIFYFIISDKPVDIKYITDRLSDFAANEKNIENSDLKFDKEYTVISFPLKKN